MAKSKFFLRKNGERKKRRPKKILHNFKCDIEISECEDEKITHRVTHSFARTHAHAYTKNYHKFLLNAIQSEWDNFWLLLLLMLILLLLLWLVVLAQCAVVRQFFRIWHVEVRDFQIWMFAIYSNFFHLSLAVGITVFVCALPPNFVCPFRNDLTKYAIFLVSIVCFLTSIVLVTMSFFALAVCYFFFLRQEPV